MPFQLIPVIDLLNGQAVHAVGGRRAHYQPLQSILHASSEPIPLVRLCRESLGLQTLYLADLDAIGGRPPRLDIARESLKSGVHLWIDAGVCDARSLTPLRELDPTRVTIVAGLETLSGPCELAEIVAQTGPEPRAIQPGPLRRPTAAASTGGLGHDESPARWPGRP